MSASAPQPNLPPSATIRDTAARWVVRQDRHLTRREASELDAWLAADSRHAMAFQQSMASWQQFRDLGTLVRRAPVPVPVSRPRWNYPALGGLAAAAALALAVIWPERGRNPETSVNVSEAGHATALSVAITPTMRELADRSVVQLKTGADIAVTYSATERRVRLVRGEAFFVVEKDAARPFFVEVGEVTVRAVGTAFAVRFEAHAVDVLVTEGAVQVTPLLVGTSVGDSGPLQVEQALVEAGQRAVVTRSGRSADAARSIVVNDVSTGEIARALAWKQPMLELAGAPLGELVAAFSQRSGRRIEIGDPVLSGVRIGGRFPLDDVNGFVRALEQVYEVDPERRADGAIVLRARAVSPATSGVR